MATDLQTIKDAYSRAGSVRGAARILGLDHTTVLERLQKAGIDTSPAARHARALEAVGYDLRPVDDSPAAAWDAHRNAFEAKIGERLAKADRIIRRKGAFVIFHATDEHVDDDGAALHLLEQDIRASHDMGAIMCHGGDLLNNWPMGGKLAKQWAEQQCTKSDALKRAQHFIDIFRPDVWVDGNHEEMNPYLADLFAQWLPPQTIRDYWRCDFTVQVPGGRDCRVALSHKFQKGNSWFHGLHGHLREMLQSEERDVYLDGHYHQAATMHHTLPERNHTALLVASAGYKLVDHYAMRISRGGSLPKLTGRAHWVLVDPFADDAAYMSTPYACPRQAMAALNGLQNLRAA